MESAIFQQRPLLPPRPLLYGDILDLQGLLFWLVRTHLPFLTPWSGLNHAPKPNIRYFVVIFDIRFNVNVN
jgi:hypothetical protein